MVSFQAGPVGGVVGGGRRGLQAAAPAVVAEDGGAGGRAGLAADDVGGEPVVAVGVLVGLDEHGVGLAGVDVEILHHERLHVVPVGLHHRHLVALHAYLVSHLLLDVLLHDELLFDHQNSNHR